MGHNYIGHNYLNHNYIGPYRPPQGRFDNRGYGVSSEREHAAARFSRRFTSLSAALSELVEVTCVLWPT